ncbi:lysylphosphatidylglycerol synthase domain-containing protein [Halobacterium yunchengense]|uniref:lysylphosphatidylglycerol synthase domain-containing protein n=1 Tax=Halobacterium yunchengense TaxID=3108497 RepID=UPI00300B2E6A
MQVDRRRVAFRVLAAALVVAALRYGVDWDGVLRNLRDADLRLFALAPVGAALALFAGAEGTRLALGFDAHSERASLARRAFLGAAVVRNLVPAGNVGGGGFVAYTVSRHGDVGVSEALAGVTTWEFVVMAASAVVGALGLAGVSVAGRDPAGVVESVALFVVALGAAVAAVAALSAYRGPVAAAVSRVTEAAHPVLARVAPNYDGPVSAADARDGIDEFFAALGALAADRGRFASVLLAAHATWACWVVALYASLLAVGVVVSPAVAMVAVTVSGFARAVPVPAGLGPVDAALGGLLVALTPHPLVGLGSALVLNRGGMLLVQASVGGLALWTLDRRVVASTAGAPDAEN